MKNKIIFFTGWLLIFTMTTGIQSCKNETDKTPHVSATASQMPNLKPLLPGKYRATKIWLEVKESLNQNQEDMLNTANEHILESEMFELLKRMEFNLRNDGRFIIKIEGSEEETGGSWELVAGNLLKTTDDETGKVEHDTIRINDGNIELHGALNMNEIDAESNAEITKNLGVSDIFLEITMKKE
ncbi:MAG: hypothetical protein ACKV1O_25775 [Saprospiraceae bacterium]